MKIPSNRTARWLPSKLPHMSSMRQGRKEKTAVEKRVPTDDWGTGQRTRYPLGLGPSWILLPSTTLIEIYHFLLVFREFMSHFYWPWLTRVHDDPQDLGSRSSFFIVNFEWSNDDMLHQHLHKKHQKLCPNHLFFGISSGFCLGHDSVEHRCGTDLWPPDLPAFEAAGRLVFQFLRCVFFHMFSQFQRFWLIFL